MDDAPVWRVRAALLAEEIKLRRDGSLPSAAGLAAKYEGRRFWRRLFVYTFGIFGLFYSDRNVLNGPEKVVPRMPDQAPMLLEPIGPAGQTVSALTGKMGFLTPPFSLMTKHCGGFNRKILIRDHRISPISLAFLSRPLLVPGFLLSCLSLNSRCTSRARSPPGDPKESILTWSNSR